MQVALFYAVSFAMKEADNKLFVSIEGGYGKSVLLSSIAAHRQN